MVLVTDVQRFGHDGTFLFKETLGCRGWAWHLFFLHKIPYTQYRRWDACCRQVECSAGREHHGALAACVKRTAEECAGEEALLLAVDALSQAAQSLEQVLLKLLLWQMTLLLLDALSKASGARTGPLRPWSCCFGCGALPSSVRP